MTSVHCRARNLLDMPETTSLTLPENVDLAPAEAARKQAIERLTVDEQIAYDKAVRSGRPGVNVDFGQRMYELYLRGISCEGIALLNPGANLGLVVRARVDGKWDE